jgi:hypothetical protein
VPEAVLARARGRRWRVPLDMREQLAIHSSWRASTNPALLVAQPQVPERFETLVTSDE